jgi:DNA-binding transcriptional ArsR family regulator
VLTVIIKSGELNISEITRRCGLSHTSAARHLEFLTKSGILAEKRFNRIRIFHVDRSNPFVGVITKFLSEWQETRKAFYRQPFN